MICLIGGLDINLSLSLLSDYWVSVEVSLPQS